LLDQQELTPMTAATRIDLAPSVRNQIIPLLPARL
jgi:hypothetical protein